MANTQAICTSFKKEILTKTHNLDSDTIKAALYLASATVGAATTAYSATNEVSGAGYTAGGVSVTNGTTATSGTTAYWTPGANITFSSVTLSTAFDCVLLYNSTATNKAIAAYTFGSQTVTSGNFTLTMPTNDASTGLLRIA